METRKREELQNDTKKEAFFEFQPGFISYKQTLCKSRITELFNNNSITTICLLTGQFNTLLNDLLHGLFIPNEVAPHNRPDPANKDRSQEKLQKSDQVSGALGLGHNATDNGSDTYS